jgi:predicted NBD/HSP70 family sugar kinase
MNKAHSDQPKNEARPSLLKQINCARLLDLLRLNPGITRAELARRTGLMRSTVSEITKELMNDGLIHSDQFTVESRSGRKGERLILNPEGALFIGVSIAKERLNIVVINFEKTVLYKKDEPIEEDKTPETVLNKLVKLIEEFFLKNPSSTQKLRGIGIAVQGTLNLNDVVIACPFLDKWDNVDLRHRLKTPLSAYINDKSKLIIDNDANAAALAEMYIETIQSNSLLYVLINHGVGAGLVIQNRVWRGFNGTAGEIGCLLLNPLSFMKSDENQSKTLNEAIGGEGLLNHYSKLSGKSENLRNLIN